MKNRIFIGLTNTAGYGSRLVKGFRSLGVEADLYVHEHHGFKYDEPNTCLIKHFSNKWLNRIYLRYFILKLMFKYHSYIFLSGNSLLKNYKDYKILRRFKKKVMVIFLGCDVQQPQLTFRKDIPFSACHNCKQEYKNFVGCVPETKIFRTRKIEENSDFIVSHIALSDSLNRNYIKVIQPINIEDFPETDNITPNQHKPVILHAPSNSGYKGTEYLLKAVDKLKNEFDFEFNMINNITISRLYEEISKSDLIVDQLIQGWYGMLPLEAMMFSKPVISYIREDVLKEIPVNCPIISANPDTIYDVLKNMLSNTDKWAEIGKEGRKFVEKYHNASDVAKSYLDILK